MKMIEQRWLICFIIGIIFLSSISFVTGIAGRCFLCSQNTLAECAGSVQPDSILFATVLQYYTEPCNGQCVLFRNENRSTIRGCSWTYGHMKPKSTGWHELTVGIQAYFCDTYLCNNGTHEQPEMSMTRTVLNPNEEFIYSPQQTLDAQQLFVMAANVPPSLSPDQYSSAIATLNRQSHQCYSCTSHLPGCGEFLDARYVSKYVRPCSTSCILFHNPNDKNMLTRDCATSWPQVRAKSGLHKLLGSDAFFCQESLCNGISFDFIMGIFHNQLPSIVTFPSLPPMVTDSTSTTMPISDSTTIPDDEAVIWEDPDLDFVLVEASSTIVPEESFSSTPVLTETPSITESIDPSTTPYIEPSSTPYIEPSSTPYIDSSTTPVIDPFEHFEFIEEIPPSSTILGGIAVAQHESKLTWWDIDDASYPSMTISTSKSHRPSTVTTTTTPMLSTLIKPQVEEYDWSIFNSTLPSPVTRLQHLVAADGDEEDDEGEEEEEDDAEEIIKTADKLFTFDSESNAEIALNVNDFVLIPLPTTTPAVKLIENSTVSFVPYYFADYKNKEQQRLLEAQHAKPSKNLAVPPFSWMLAGVNTTAPRARQSLLKKNSTSTTITTTTTTTTAPITTTTKTKQKKLIATMKKKSFATTTKTTTTTTSVKHLKDSFYEYCEKKECRYGGRLTPDCLCVCLPAFTGDNCETIRCDDEPANICDFALEHECESEYVRYLCPKFCKMNFCTSNRS